MRRWWWLAVAAMGLPLLAGEPPLSLSEALREVSRSSAPAVISGLDLEAARDRTREARSAYYPSVDVEGGHTNLDNDPFFVFGPESFPAGEQVFWGYRVSARQVLTDGGRRKTAIEAAHAEEAAATEEALDAVRRAQVEAVRLYVEVLSVRARKEAVGKRREALEDHHRVVNDLYEEGVVARNDLLRTEVALRGVEDQMRALESAEHVALASLNRGMGRDPSAPVEVSQAMPLPPPLPWTLERCREKARDGNAAAGAAEAHAEAVSHAVSLARKDYHPVSFVEAGHSYEQNRYMLYPHVNFLFVGLAWNVFDGGARAARAREAERQEEKAQRNVLEAQRMVAVLVERAFRDYHDSLAEVETARDNVEAALENLRIVNDQYSEGLARTTDVLDAESVLAESRMTLATQRYRAYTAQALLLAAVGEDLPAFYEGLSAAPPKEPKHP